MCFAWGSRPASPLCASLRTEGGEGFQGGCSALVPPQQGLGKPSSPKPRLRHVLCLHTRVVATTSRVAASSSLCRASCSLQSVPSCSFDFLAISYMRKSAVNERLASLQESTFHFWRSIGGGGGGWNPTVHRWPLTKHTTTLQSTFRFPSSSMRSSALPPAHATDLSHASQVALQFLDLLLFLLHGLLALVLLLGDSALQNLRIGSPQFRYRKKIILLGKRPKATRKATRRVTALEQGHIMGEKFAGHKGMRVPGERYSREAKELLLSCSLPASLETSTPGDNHSQSDRHRSTLEIIL